MRQDDGATTTDGAPAPASGGGDVPIPSRGAGDAAPGDVADPAGPSKPGPAAGTGRAARAGRPGRLARARAVARNQVRHPARPLAALVCGLAMGLAFPPYDVWWLSIVAVAGLSVVVHGLRPRAAFGYGLLFGLPFMLWLLKWLRVVGTDAWIVLSIVQALYLAGLAALLAVASRARLWPLWTACLWVAQELVRDRVPFGGFPWGRLAFANTATPYTPFAKIAGAPAVTLTVALSGALLAWAVLRVARHVRERGTGTVARAAVAGAGGAVALAVAVPAAAYTIPIPTAGDAEGPDHVTVAVVQGNVPRTGLDFLGQRRAVLDNHARETHRLAQDVREGRVPRPDLVIWPENSSDLDPFQARDAWRIIDAAVKDIGVPVLTGILVDGPDDTHVQNQGVVWDPVTGPGDSYTKRHPVPFGEYIPMRDLLTKVISRLERVPRDFYAGRTVGVLQVGPARIGDVICFEVAYDNIVREAVTHGGRVLVVQTNNATYGRSGQPEQQLAMSRLRAVEHGRAILIAATSGISGIIGPDGKVIERTREFTADTITMSVPLRDDLTPAARMGAAPEWIISGFGVLAVLLVVVRTRRNAARPAVVRPVDRSTVDRGPAS